MTHWYRPPKKKKNNNPTTPIGDHSDLFTVFCKDKLGYEPIKEYRFHPTRKWRFDYAIIPYRVALEVEGGVWTQGRHTQPKGFLGDIEKYNSATLLGWKVLRTTPDSLMSAKTIEMLKCAINA